MNFDEISELVRKICKGLISLKGRARNLVRHRILTIRMEIFLSSKLNLTANQSLPGAGSLSS